ncbi:MAG: hypothetical protein Q9191_005858 [Dirinaria sp. TL-2023a]
MPKHHRHGSLMARDTVTTEDLAKGPSVEIIYQFPNNTWLENLAVRSNALASQSLVRKANADSGAIKGQVLVTVMTSPDLYLIDPTNRQPVLVHSFTNHLGLLGIVELQHDVFCVIAGNYSQQTNTNTPGAWDIYCVNMLLHPPAVVHSAHLPKAVLLDGMDVLNASEGLLLVGDAGAGILYRVCVHSGAVEVVIEDPTMKPTPGNPVGIDGIKIRDKTLYFTNPCEKTFVKIPLHDNGTAAASSEVVAKGAEVDDFVFDNAGNGYMSVFSSHGIGLVASNATNIHVVANSSTALAGPTACRFGRMPSDSNMLYVSTNGGLGVGPGPAMPGGTLSRVSMARYIRS